MSEVTLEMSLKPFKAIDNASIDRVITRMFRQWAMVIEKFDSVAVLLWSADGSELLDYSGLVFHFKCNGPELGRPTAP